MTTDELYDAVIRVGDTLLYSGANGTTYSFMVDEKRQGWLFVHPCDIFRGFHSSVFHKYDSDLPRLYKVKEVFK